jgi:hypothetical protein
MSELTIKHRAALVRKSWSYAEQLQRALAAQHRCHRLLEQLGLIGGERRLAYAHRPSNPCGRLSG